MVKFKDIQSLTDDALQSHIAETRGRVNSTPDSDWIIKETLQTNLEELESELTRRTLSRDFPKGIGI